jgi:hypothetical protein
MFRLRRWSILRLPDCGRDNPLEHPGLMPYFWLGREAEDIEPYCDGDLPDMECIESDGLITCYFSGPIQPLPQS